MKCTYVHTYRNPKNTKHLRLSWFRYETFITLSLGFQHEDRETQFFYADCSFIVSSQLTDTINSFARTPQSTNGTSLAQVRKINSLRLSPNLNSLLLFKIPWNPSPSLPRMTSFKSPVPFPIRGFYCDICDCHILPVCT